MRNVLRAVCGTLLSTVFFCATAQAADDVAAALRWRLIGPFRAGWSTMAAGVPDRPDEFYFSAAGGGVWKTEDAGATWHSLGDTLGAAAVEAVPLAASHPNLEDYGSENDY
jgi:hypothetical protein